MLWLLILKDGTRFHREENKTQLYTKRNDSEQVVYQTKNRLREVQQQDREKKKVSNKCKIQCWMLNIGIRIVS